jgi:hypothetical protein
MCELRRPTLCRRFSSDSPVTAQGITLEYNSKIAPARGMSSGGKITLLPGLSHAEHFAVPAHELLHRGDRRMRTTHKVRETEAEAEAFVVSSATQTADFLQTARLLQGSGPERRFGGLLVVHVQPV